ncbi:SCO family protein [Hymenobacter algoricola]|uniref:Thioredoxin domain-containing protein n=1 Tax=Hymenobacter algoricola TaxID=486267 RepID=A0ABP7MYP3_9BACT
MTFSFLRRTLGVSLLTLGSALLLPACTTDTTATAEAERLPFIGEREIRPRADGGPADTLYATIPAFRLTNQDGQVITNDTFAGKVYITDFFFATCPSICPKMQSELLRVYTQFKGDPRVLLLSHTIDPAHDSIPVLRDYAQRLGIQDASRWHFATASHDSIFALARAYMTAAQVDKQVPGGYAHSGAFALVDPQRRIRGVYDGMNPLEVQRLLDELPLLLQEVEQEQKAAR